MAEIHAGVVCVTKFVTPSSDTYTGYLNYIDRDAATRNEHYKDFNAFEKNKRNYEDYHEYMDDPEKSTELFTSEKDSLSFSEKKFLKDVFKTAQKNESVMWQTVLSFDNNWLAKNGIYDIENKILDENKMRELTRDAVLKLTKEENISHTAKWCASIHYNTEHIHVHIAMVEPIPTRPKVYYNGKYQYRGKFKQSSIDQTKSAVVNKVLNQKKENEIINHILRRNILDKKKQRNIMEDVELADKLKKLYEQMPENRKKWFYNTKEMAHLKPLLNDISKAYLERYHANDMDALQNKLEERENLYSEAYGHRKIGSNQYTENKMKDLYTRLGNAILSDLKIYDKALKEEYFRHLKQSTYKGKNRSFEHYKKTISMGKLMAALKRTMNDEIRQHYKNQNAYEQLQQKEIESLER